MAILGLKMVHLAIVDKYGRVLKKDEGGFDTKDGVYAVTMADQGTATANLSNIDSGNPNLIYGNNGVVDATYGQPQPQIAYTFNNLPFEVQNKMQGNVDDGNGGVHYSGKKPYVATLLNTQSLDRKDVLFGFAKGIMVENNTNVGTDTNNPTRTNDSWTYTAIGVDRWNQQAMKRGFEGQDGYDYEEFYNDTFGIDSAGDNQPDTEDPGIGGSDSDTGK